MLSFRVKKTIVLIKMKGRNFSYTFSIFTYQSLSQTCVCKVHTSAKFMSIPQIVLNNDIFAEKIEKYLAFAFFEIKKDSVI